MTEAEGVRLRRAKVDDVDFLLGLLGDAEVEPYLAAVSARDRPALLEEIERSEQEPDEFGRLLIEVEEEGAWERAGTMRFEVRNRRSRIASLGGTAARLIQRYLVLELDYHRLELEIYGFNERAIAHAERVGFVRGGVKRRAYLRNGEWVDGVLFGLIREDLDEVSAPR